MVARFLTKQQVISMLSDLAKSGWIKSLKPLNSGGIGNTLDSLLGLSENNLPISDTAQWEMKTHRKGSASLLTLFHMEPEPRVNKIVTEYLLPNYGWPDQHRPNELSFRQTLRATDITDRGFGIGINKKKERIYTYFDSKKVDTRHKEWLNKVEGKVGLGELQPEPFWLFKDLFLKASVKLLNTFHVEIETKRTKKEEFFKLVRVLILQGFAPDKFIKEMEKGSLLVDFDARTHHNHGTKFRLRQDSIPDLYMYVDLIYLSPELQIKKPQPKVQDQHLKYKDSSDQQPQLFELD
jgi:hypothetical protein